MKIALQADDGFSKLVHARQPRCADVLDESGNGAPIARDVGVQLGWDDGTNAEVLSGLQKNDRVVLGNGSQFVNGQKVHPRESTVDATKIGGAS